MLALSSPRSTKRTVKDKKTLNQGHRVVFLGKPAKPIATFIHEDITTWGFILPPVLLRNRARESRPEFHLISVHVQLAHLNPLGPRLPPANLNTVTNLVSKCLSHGRSISAFRMPPVPPTHRSQFLHTCGIGPELESMEGTESLQHHGLLCLWAELRQGRLVKTPVNVEDLISCNYSQRLHKDDPHLPKVCAEN